MSILVKTEILGLFVNTLTADNKSFLPNIEHLRQPIQMISSKKQIFFEIFFLHL